ncbi:speckle targeted PIP5K1A-regulated poly(A) polymerase-like isoform X1 [Cylas formicarius]|uniref:speckle targeted PIP5K1A-regulated poly(A) polymerase-like isoform X1 n=1 Tax=Cylas formicarius TaxID=197179 RepID=UPI0029587B44|nr:speckle targeted PIP5K1A-regulated poly(A) polymerase-like isoform X1 [Cylas formicarius]
MAQKNSIVYQKGKRKADNINVLNRRPPSSPAQKNDNKELGIFVRGFSPNTADSDITKYFSKFGNVVKAHFGPNFALLDFTASSSVEKVMAIRKHVLNGRRLIIKHKRPNYRNVLEENAKEDKETFNDIIKNLMYPNGFVDQSKFLVDRLQSNLESNLRRYSQICQDFYNVLCYRFPNVEIHPFGSTVTGLGFNNSDIDVYIANVRRPHNSEIECLDELRAVLSKTKIFLNIMLISAKIPILRCFHANTKIKCDININNSLGICNTKLIHYYIHSHPKVKTMMIIIKYWAKLHKLTGQSHLFTNYALALLFIFFLQQKPYNFPNVFSLQQNESTNIIAHNYWNGNFTPDYSYSFEEITRLPENELLQGFFKFYGDFSYQSNVISPYLGIILDSSQFKSIIKLPKTFTLYRQYLSLEYGPSLRIDTPICLQDPFEHCSNNTVMITESTLSKFVLFCRLGEKNCAERECVLHKLLTEEPSNFKPSENEFSNDHLQFALTKPTNIAYLQSPSTTNKTENTRWFETVTNFVVIAFKDFLSFEVVDDMEGPVSSKIAKSKGQSDIHDSKTKYFTCCGATNYWKNRKSEGKQPDIKNCSTLFEREATITKRLKNIYKNIQHPRDTIKFKLILVDKDGEALVILEKISAYKKKFKSFCMFIRAKLPEWFDLYQKDLNKLTNEN